MNDTVLNQLRSELTTARGKVTALEMQVKAREAYLGNGARMPVTGNPSPVAGSGGGNGSHHSRKALHHHTQAKLLRLLNDGKLSQPAIAKLLKVSGNTVQRYKKKFKAAGKLKVAKPEGQK